MRSEAAQRSCSRTLRAGTSRPPRSHWPTRRCTTKRPQIHRSQRPSPTHTHSLTQEKEQLRKEVARAEEHARLANFKRDELQGALAAAEGQIHQLNRMLQVAEAKASDHSDLKMVREECDVRIAQMVRQMEAQQAEWAKLRKAEALKVHDHLHMMENSKSNMGLQLAGTTVLLAK